MAIRQTNKQKKRTVFVAAQNTRAPLTENKLTKDFRQRTRSLTSKLLSRTADYLLNSN